MSELVPIPLPLLLRRAFLEYQRESKIFDLPSEKFFRGFPDLDLSVDFHGHRASTPLGPAAGPHGQLAQNIALSWLGGCRIIELKTIQKLDELQIPRPCIDAANVGYNVEWSQELTLEQSLREYVCASMFLEILRESKLLGDGIPAETVFDMSVGYNLEGIRSPRVREWIGSMMDATRVIDELRIGLTGPWARYRDLPFAPRVSDTVSLSTFHGCPAGEIEGIVTYLLAEMGCHVCVKLNPTLLGRERTAHLLHDVLGYREIRLHDAAFENDLQFEDALDLIPRLQDVARRHGRHFSVKLTNTLVVKNHKGVFSDDLMYMSGPPLHVLAMTLARRFRDRLAAPVPMSFSGGLEANNIAPTVAMNFVPVTTCTDLLRPGGYARLSRYLENLATSMREVGVRRIADYVIRYAGEGAAAIEAIRARLEPGQDLRLYQWLATPDVPLHTVCPEVEADLAEAAGILNTPYLVRLATQNPRYAWERNRGVPRKIDSKLAIYDCINCDKCVPVCPNDANFAYEMQPLAIEYDNLELSDAGMRRIPGGVLRVAKAHQLANYADACNECGNCELFCPEDGGPQSDKPRFFGSLESFWKHANGNGFYIEGLTIYGATGGHAYVLKVHDGLGTAHFEQEDVAVEVRLSDGEPLSWRLKPAEDPTPRHVKMLAFWKLKLLLESVGDPKHVHFANVAGLQEITSDQR